MKILPLVTYPDPLLKQVSKPVDKVDDTLREFMKDMVSTMYVEHGIGLAAVQVGKLQRILVIDIDYEQDESPHHDHHHCHGIHVKNTNPRYFVNPKIVESSLEESSYNEGCLSFPGARSEVIRPAKVRVEYLDFNGSKKIEEMTGLLATCIQHEIDHLNGITFVDHISKMKREVIIKKLLKAQRNA